MKLIRKLIIAWAVLLCVFVWGVASVKYRIFPHTAVRTVTSEIDNFIAGHSEEESTTTEKILNDLDLVPNRLLSKNFSMEKYFNNVRSTHPARDYDQLTINGLRSRRISPQIYISDNIQGSGYYFIFGIFDFVDHMAGAILIDHNAMIINTWVLDESRVVAHFENLKNTDNHESGNSSGARKYKSPVNRNPNGVDILSDGSLILNDGSPGNVVQRIDHCSNAVWQKFGDYHHVVQLDPATKSFWVALGDSLAQLDTETGEIISTIPWDLVRENNPDIDLDLRYDMKRGNWFDDPMHLNDIDPLPDDLADSFPFFESGDLLLSYRSLSLLVVIDPDTYRIKWWRAGATRRQHDPDWQQDGTITVYNNNMRVHKNPEPWEAERFSNIIKINPGDNAVKKIYDGRQDDFYSRIQGDHQILPNGNILITSSQQGRVFEVTTDGEIVFEFFNRYDQERNLMLSQARWLPGDFFDTNLTDPGKCLNKSS